MNYSIEASIPSCIHDYAAVEVEDGRTEVTAKCVFPATFIGFDGHFHDNPVLPAIVQLATVRHIVEQCVSKSLIPANFSRAKFRAMIKPDQAVVFRLNIISKEKQFIGKFNIRSSNDDAIAEGNYVFHESL